MGIARKKAVEVEFITFNEFVEYGHKFIKENPTKGNYGFHDKEYKGDGLPWSFQYQGHPITHEDNKCYLVPTLEGTMRFTPEDVLITGVKGEIYPCKIDIFEATYNIVVYKKEGFSFGLAIGYLKQGKKVARKGWNGKGMWLKLVNMQEMDASPDCPEIAWTDKFINLPTIAMKTADDKLLFGWLASQTDMLAEDWIILE